MIRRLQHLVAGLALAGWVPLATATENMPGGPSVLEMSLPDPASSIARGQHFLYDVLLWVCAVIFVLVFSVMFYSIFKHRKSKGAKPADFHESTVVEVIWTVIPFLIVIGLGAMATGQVIEQKDTSNADITIKATGYQWKWGYEYLKGEGEGISFLSTITTPYDQIANRAPKSNTYLMEVDHPLVVPVGKKIRIVTTAADVIHAFFVPRLGIKQDAIPGFVRDTWFKADMVGTYRGDCALLCGKNHAFMPIVVEVKSAQDYDKWVEAQKKEIAAKADDPNKVWTLPELMARGQKVYSSICIACHQANGKGIPGMFPALDGSKTVLGPKADQIKVELNGRPGTAMAAFRNQLSDTEIAAVVTYTRNSWSNKAAENVVQPKEVAAERAATK